MYLISTSDVEEQALIGGASRADLEMARLVFLTFNRCVVEELSTSCQLQEWEWPAAGFTPAYSPPHKSWQGKLDEDELRAFIPPMGASTLVSFCEELIHYGAEVILLLCASWGLGKEQVEEGEIHLPSFAVGMDATSPHYGNHDWRVEAEPTAYQALAAGLDKVGARWKQGGVGCCEAFYRITPQMAEDFREQGCLSMENGETAALYALARERDITIGVLLQPYIDLEQGWSLSYMGDKYAESGRLQVRAALEASRSLLGKGS